MNQNPKPNAEPVRRKKRTGGNLEPRQGNTKRNKRKAERKVEMKATIISVTMENGYAVATYTTGTVRRYQEGAIPKTVMAWMEANTSPLPAEEEPDEEPILEELTMEPVPAEEEPSGERELPAIVKPVQEPEGEPERMTEVPLEENPGADKRKAVKLSLGDVVPVAVSALLWVADKALDGWYGLTTWGPILIRRLIFFLAWDVLPVIGKALVAMRAPALAILQGAARWVCVGLLTGAGAVLVSSRAIRKAVVTGWAMRDDILREMAA